MLHEALILLDHRRGKSIVFTADLPGLTCMDQVIVLMGQQHFLPSHYLSIGEMGRSCTWMANFPGSFARADIALQTDQHKCHSWLKQLCTSTIRERVSLPMILLGSAWMKWTPEPENMECSCCLACAQCVPCPLLVSQSCQCLLACTHHCSSGNTIRSLQHLVLSKWEQVGEAPFMATLWGVLWMPYRQTHHTPSKAHWNQRVSAHWLQRVFYFKLIGGDDLLSM